MSNLRNGNQNGAFFIVRAATTTNITLANLQTVDNVVLVAGDLVLVKDQTDQRQNGIYTVVDGGPWTRASNFNTSPKLYPGLFLTVMEGTANKITYWKLNNPRPIVLNVDNIVFSVFNTGGGGGGGIAVSAGTQVATTGTVIFSNSNGLTFGMSNSSVITGSYTVPSTAGLISRVNVSAGTTSNNLSNFVFSNSNNVSFGLNGSTITASVAPPSAANVNFSAGTTSNNLSAVTFSNSNGLSFGLDGSTITGSYTVPTQTNQTVGLYGLGNTTQNSSTTLDARSLSFNGLGNITIGYSNGSIQLSGSQTAQTQNVVVPSAGTQTATSGTVVFSNSNNITFGMSGSSRVTASYNFNLSAGTTSNNLNAVTFNDGNNVSFGLNGSIVTASVATSLTNINVSAGTTSNNLSAITFSNANNVSFGLNASTITASIPLQTNQTVGLYGLGNTTQNSSTTLDARSLSLNGLGIITVGYSNGSIQLSATQSAQTQSNIQAVYDGANSISTGTIRFSNSNGVSFGINGQTITASHNGITSQTNQTVGLYALGNTTQNSSTTLDARTLSLNGLGGATIGYSNGSIQISAPTTVGLISAVNISGGTTSNNLTAVTFSNANNVSFGLNASTVTASASFNQTNQTVGLYALGNTTQNSSTTLDARSLSFNGLGAATIGYSNGSIQVSVPVQTAQTQSNIQAIYDGANSISTGTIRFSNSNGVSFGINGQTITASINALTNINISAGTTSNNLTALTFSNINGVSFGLDASTITASVAAQTNQTVGLYALGNTTQNSSTTLDARSLSFNGLGNITVGYSNGSVQLSGSQSNQTLGKYAIGNTVGQSSSSTFDARTMSFSGAGIASVGYSNNALIVSVPSASINFSAGTTSNNLNAITFSNANGVTFGLDGSTITASVVPPTGAVINVSAGTTSNNVSAITFSDANGLAFGLDGSTITGSYTVPVQTNQTVGLYALGNTTQNSSSTRDARSLSFNGLGIITVGYSNGSIQLSATQSAQTQNLIQAVYDGANSITTGTIRFSNSNGVSFGINGQTITASHNGITSQTNQTVGLYALGNTTQNSSTTLDARSLSLNGLGAATVGYSNGSIQISVPNALTNINISAGTTSNNLTAVTFSNANNVSFGLNGSTVTATATFAQTNQTIGLYALGNTTQNSSTTLDARTLSFNGLGGATVGYSNGSIQISAPTTAGLISRINVSAGTTSNNLSALTFANSNGISFGLDASTITASYTVPTQTNQTIGLYALGNTTQNSSTTLDARTLSFNGLGAATVGYSNGSIQLSVPVQTVQTQSLIQAIYDGANSITTGTIRFTNANGVSFSINGQTISGSVAVQTNQTVGLYALGNTTQNSSTTLDARSLSFNGLGAATIGYSNGSIQVSVPVQTVQTQSLIAALYDGANSITTGTARFSNSNGISFGINGQTITASHNGITSQTNQTIGLYALGNTTGQSSSSTFDARTLSVSGMGEISVGYSGNNLIISSPARRVSQLIWPEAAWQTNFNIFNASMSWQHFNAKQNITASQANLLMALSGDTNSSGALTVSLGIYTMAGSTMSLASSDSRVITWTSGSQTTNSTIYGGISGTRYRTVALNNWSITANGDYVIGMWFRTTNNGTWRAFGQQGPTIVGAIDANETNHYNHGHFSGSYTTAMIGSVNVTDTNYVRTGANALQQPGVVFLGSY